MDTTKSPAHLASIEVSWDLALKTPQTPHKKIISSVILTKITEINYKIYFKTAKLVLKINLTTINKKLHPQ